MNANAESSHATTRKMIQEKVLVVEDDQYLREEIIRILDKRTTFRVSAAADAESALQLAAQEHFDLLVTDVRMPGMSGIELLDQLKQRQPELQSIIITAFADEQATIKALKIGANDYIRKPFSIQDLVNAINRQTTILRLKNEASRHRQMLNGIVTSLNAGVLAIDENGVIAAINSSAGDILDLDVESTLGRPARTALPSGNRSAGDSILRLFEEMTVRQLPFIEKEISFTRDGLPVTFLVSANDITGSAGQKLGKVVLFDDVSDLILAQKITAWKDLARTVAHEIKNPLTPIKLSAQQLMMAKNSDRETLDHQLEIALKNIMKNADRLNTLAYEFSRFGRLPSEVMKPVDVGQLLEEAVAPFRQNTDYKAITLTINVAADLPPINGDYEALLRMVSNLTANACEAMPNGGEVVISAGKQGDTHVRISVADTGTGIADEVKENLFRPYVTSKAGGTGLGLVVVKEVVNRHNGEIHVESLSGSGSTFRIDLPIS